MKINCLMYERSSLVASFLCVGHCQAKVCMKGFFGKSTGKVGNWDDIFVRKSQYENVTFSLTVLTSHFFSLVNCTRA